MSSRTGSRPEHGPAQHRPAAYRLHKPQRTWPGSASPSSISASQTTEAPRFWRTAYDLLPTGFVNYAWLAFLLPGRWGVAKLVELLMDQVRLHGVTYKTLHDLLSVKWPARIEARGAFGTTACYNDKGRG